MGHHVTTINRVAEDLGEDEDWLRDVANEMEIEDGAIWVYGVGEHGIQIGRNPAAGTYQRGSDLHEKIAPNAEKAGRLARKLTAGRAE